MRCQCEHIAHETPTEAVHPYLCEQAPAGKHRALFVGPICDDCAVDHLFDYLIPDFVATDGQEVQAS